jgi:hypothetical protein
MVQRVVYNLTKKLIRSPLDEKFLEMISWGCLQLASHKWAASCLHSLWQGQFYKTNNLKNRGKDGQKIHSRRVHLQHKSWNIFALRGEALHQMRQCSKRERKMGWMKIKARLSRIWFLAYQLKSRGLIFTLACPAQAFIIITWRDRVIYHEHFCTFFNDNFISPFLLSLAESRVVESCTHTHPHTLFSLFLLSPRAPRRTHHRRRKRRAATTNSRSLLGAQLFKTSENTLEQFKKARKSIKGLIPILFSLPRCARRTLPAW